MARLWSECAPQVIRFLLDLRDTAAVSGKCLYPCTQFPHQRSALKRNSFCLLAEEERWLRQEMSQGFREPAELLGAVEHFPFAAEHGHFQLQEWGLGLSTSETTALLVLCSRHNSVFWWYKWKMWWWFILLNLDIGMKDGKFSEKSDSI